MEAPSAAASQPQPVPRRHVTAPRTKHPSPGKPTNSTEKGDLIVQIVNNRAFASTSATKNVSNTGQSYAPQRPVMIPRKRNPSSNANEPNWRLGMKENAHNDRGFNTHTQAQSSKASRNNYRPVQFKGAAAQPGPPQGQPPRRSGSQGAASEGRAQGSPPSAPPRARGRRQRLRDMEDLDDPDARKKVLVFGFPAYTQSQDLARVLAELGSFEVERCRNRLAVVRFASEAEACAALAASEQLCVYGEFPTINPYTNAAHVDEMYRSYRKIISKDKKLNIIEPGKIDLSGDFREQLTNIENAIRLNREEVKAISSLYADLETILQQHWAGCKAIPFGSITTGLGIKSSDADCFIDLPPQYRGRGGSAGAGAAAATFVNRARRLLAQYPALFGQIVAIPRANTPIVKFLHVPTGTHCDVSAKTPLGVQNSRLIALLLAADVRFVSLSILVKYWAKVHMLSGSGKLTNYALTMLMIFYLQSPPLAMLPPVEKLQQEPEARLEVDHWDAGFATSRDLLVPLTPCTLSVAELLGGFFQFYATFDFEKLVVCPYLGEPVPKALFEDLATVPPQFSRYIANVKEDHASAIRHGTVMCVQDPIEQSHNVASSVNPRLAEEIQEYFKFAAAAYKADEGNGYREFLKVILLQKPKMEKKGNMRVTTKVCLLPRLRGEILDPDWRGVVKDVLLDGIFDTILKTKLEQVEEADKDDDPDCKMEKEKYSGSVNKPVWRRKKFNFNAKIMETEWSLINKHEAITEQILQSSSPETPMKFDLELCFQDEPRTFRVIAKLLEGDLEMFKGFVRFMHSTMIDWFRILLKPYLKPEERKPVRDGKQRTQIEEDDSYTTNLDCTIEFTRSDHSDISNKMDAVSLNDKTHSESIRSKQQTD